MAISTLIHQVVTSSLNIQAEVNPLNIKRFHFTVHFSEEVPHTNVLEDNGEEVM